MSRFSGTAGPSHFLPSARGTKRKRQLSHLPGDSINPLSHPPAVLKQFHVAGFPNTELAPSDSVVDFPHRPWKDVGPTAPPPDAKSGSSMGSRDTFFSPAASSIKKGGNGRDKLLSPLRECVQVCLERGDVHRAKKAMAGLAYAVNDTPQGRGSTCPWSLQAEFIMNEDEKRPESRRKLENDDEKTQPGAWDSGKAMPKLREYLSSLIAEQSKGVSNPVSAPLLNLWWALLSAELYGASSAASYTGRKDGRATDGEYDPVSSGVSELGECSIPRSEPWHFSENRPRNVDIAKDKGRGTVIGMVETTVQHLGRLVHSKPYKTDQDLLRLYAAALLFLADLRIPPQYDAQSERSLVYQERDALRNQARGILDGIVRLGGQIDHRLQRILDSPFGR